MSCLIDGKPEKKQNRSLSGTSAEIHSALSGPVTV
jgi:hypothetical protein